MKYIASILLVSMLIVTDIQAQAPKILFPEVTGFGIPSPDIAAADKADYPVITEIMRRNTGKDDLARSGSKVITARRLFQEKFIALSRYSGYKLMLGDVERKFKKELSQQGSTPYVLGNNISRLILPLALIDREFAQALNDSEKDWWLDTNIIRKKVRANKKEREEEARKEAAQKLRVQASMRLVAQADPLKKPFRVRTASEY